MGVIFEFGFLPAVIESRALSWYWFEAGIKQAGLNFNSDKKVYFFNLLTIYCRNHEK